MESVFRVINIAGFIIGIFALIVGYVSVANIMFCIGQGTHQHHRHQKKPSAPKICHPPGVLIESIILCLIAGGLVGLGLVFITQIISSPFHSPWASPFANMSIRYFHPSLWA